MIDLDKLKSVDTPARYTGGEARQYIKNSSVIDLRVCLMVPAIYEFGMFDFDLKDMYYILNSKKDIWAERCFAPLIDFEQVLRENNEKLYTLESKTPLKNMDVLFCILSSEMMYTNMLNMFNLGGIPILKQRRKEGFPIVIATGSAVLNPKPLEKFVDAFIIGEAPIIANEIAKCIKENKTKTKDEVLELLSSIYGVYVPGVTKNKVHMVKELDIDSVQAPKNMVIPSINTLMDKSLVMLSKGCNKNCVTCSHKYVYGAPEYMSLDKAVLKTKRIVNVTGNTDVVLMSNCYGDYPHFPDIIYKLKDLDRPKIKNISFMEVKLNKDNLWLLKYMEDLEDYPSIIVGASTKALRKRLGIEMEEEDVLNIAKEVFLKGFNKIRLKYIIGVPKENYEDLNKILELANKICKLYKELCNRCEDKYIVEINLYTFKPKPHTPSEWATMNSSENIEIKQRYLLDKNNNDKVIITKEEPKQAIVETLLARGDENVSDVIYEAYKAGARNDMLEPMFNFEAWQIALNNAKVDIKKYLSEIDCNEELPWDNILVGTPKEELKKIYLEKIKGD